MSRISLPSISGSASVAEEKSPTIFDVQPIAEEDEVGETLFDTSFQRLVTIQFAPVNPDASVKNRISLLEESTQAQHDFNRLTGKTFQNLSNDVHTLEEMMRDYVKQTQTDIEGKITVLKKEYDHR
jgi:hypothetical protein